MRPSIKIDAAKLKSLREAKKWNTTQAAFHCGVSYSHYLNLENKSRNVDPKTLTRICEVFEVEKSELATDPARIFTQKAKQAGIRLNPNLQDFLKRHAKTQGRSFSQVCALALTEYACRLGYREFDSQAA